MNGYTENEYEQALVELFQSLEGKQYRYEYGPDIERDYSNPLLDDVLQSSLQRINPELPASAIQYGIEVQYTDEKHQVKTKIVNLIDYGNEAENDFLVVNQFTMQEHDTKRPDIVVFVNGLPLVVIELKSPSCKTTT